jgi:peroxiredoxin Q/BCP
MKSFTERVYDVVRKIPKGKTMTYGAVAMAMGDPGAARAVGNALNKNRNKDVPCHRVIRSDGSIGGFAWGSAAKKEILKREGAIKRENGKMWHMLKIGSKAPEFTLPDQDGKMHSLKDQKGKWTLIYFYPKDDTPGCTVEACTIRDNYASFKKMGITVWGISVDPVKKHAKFVEKYSLPFTLLSDEEKKVVNAYKVWGKKKFMGREYMGTNRVSFLIDQNLKISKIYETVKPAEHAKEVLGDAKAMK